MNEYRAKIKHIVDGDTVDVDIDLGFDIWLKDQRIRLEGVDAPESRTSDKVEKVYGLMAKDAVTRLCPVGSEIVLKTYLDRKGKFGRILGVLVTEGGVNVNQYLIENHLAVAYHGQSKADIAEAHLANRALIESAQNR